MSDLSHLPTAAEVFAEMDAEMERTALVQRIEQLERECIALRERCERLDYERWRLQREKDRASL